eukprot:CAMPEP_0201503120 /NCGR_PEP_ID=MMETSP0151_2-20130828/84496_1 /ASSEMBLY_ACC=CAM_ASM_000257 /TAXON_ID=200890 /ORGANISM="Paramoeba atlantica, Strain 621/1 / CCAP 1560/9" /LENGTH=793 /DNA_ID=CAMNT_0047896753 /DNA_START=80 /DNA_END=2461 /DNA_ORIENTATION=-
MKAEEEEEDLRIQKLMRDLERIQVRKSRSFCQKKRDSRDDCPNGICDPLYPQQWHLHKSALAENPNVTEPEKLIDMGVVPAWNLGYFGDDILISIVDDGVEHHHPDLNSGYVKSVSYDFVSGMSDPSPSEADDHGTSCAGVAFARQNDACGVGVANKALYGAVRLIGESGVTSATEAEALTYGLNKVDIYSCSWGPADDGTTVFKLPSPIPEALEQGVNEGRKGLGSVYIWAAGNGGHTGDSCSYDGYVNSQFSIPVGAVDEYGVKAYYSESCPALLGVTASSGDTFGIITTDRTKPYGYDENSDCTSTFGGTSASAPMASGITALVLQAKPQLSWRDVQGVLLQSTVHNDPLDDDWSENGAGLKINHKYGFGLLNATRAVELATRWTMLEQYSYYKSNKVVLKEDIPLEGEVKYSFEVTVNDTLGKDAEVPVDPSVVEHVILTVDISHPMRNKLAISLTSPSGTTSFLSIPHLVGYLPTLYFLPDHKFQGFLLIGNGTGFGPSLDTPVQDAIVAMVDDACSEISSSFYKNMVPLVPMVPECSPLVQVRNLQASGAAAVVFSPDYYGPLVEVDVGNEDTSDISIPSMTIDRLNAEFLYSYLSENNAPVFTVKLNTTLFPQKDFKNYPFMSMRHWGEKGVGEWVVRVVDTPLGDEEEKKGVLKSLKLELFGTGFARAYKYHPGLPSTNVILGFLAIFLLVIAAVTILIAYLKCPEYLLGKKIQSYEIEDGLKVFVHTDNIDEEFPSDEKEEEFPADEKEEEFGPDEKEEEFGSDEKEEEFGSDEKEEEEEEFEV